MFKKKPTSKLPLKIQTATESAAPRYQHPKILLIDMDIEVSKVLKNDGYNVSTGTFGIPYMVQKGSGYQPVLMNPSLPNYAEQEVIVIDLVPAKVEQGPSGEKFAPMADPDWWAKCNLGEIDPRPMAMAMVQQQSDRILASGGAFIVFSDARDKRELVYAQKDGNNGGLRSHHALDFDNWSFLSVLSKLAVNSDYGEEIYAAKQEGPLARLLAESLEEATFRCTFDRQWYFKEHFVALAKNKYGAAVAGMIGPTEDTANGWILILPRIKHKDRFLSALLKDILPEFSPRLFPHAEGQKWVHRPEYELSSVTEKAAQIASIQDDAAKKVAALEIAIGDDRNANQFLYDLIRETGNPLVEAIKKAISFLGFQSVVDVDDEMRKAGKDAPFREDLRVHDKSPILVVDIKGVAGKPADAEALQAQKHAFIYIQEQGRNDVRGLTIINHQRQLPPLERDNEMPFRKEILDNAAQVNLGLMTTWDLFRLVRGFTKNKWRPEQVIPVFYQTGRISPIPEHYEFIGKVKQVWRSAFSVEIVHGDIRVGDGIAVEFPVDFDEQEVTSLRLNDADVSVAAATCEVGIQRHEASLKLKAGMSVYRIKTV